MECKMKISDKLRSEIEDIVIAEMMVTANKPSNIEEGIRVAIQLTLNEVEELENEKQWGDIWEQYLNEHDYVKK